LIESSCYENKKPCRKFHKTIFVKLVKVEAKATLHVGADFVMGCILRQEQKLTGDFPAV
jgi:hypothetical protein